MRAVTWSAMAVLVLCGTVLSTEMKVQASNQDGSPSSTVAQAPQKAAPASDQNGRQKNLAAVSERTKEQELNKVIAEALAAYQETLNAVEALERNDKEAALAALERAAGKLDILLGRFPAAAFLPIDVRVETIELATDLDAIKRQKEELETLIRKGYLQMARRILDYMVSEIRITTVNLPMMTYPAAIQGAARYIEEGKLEQAKMALQGALSTLVTLERSIPIPLINAQYFVAQAARLAEQHKDQALDAQTRDRILKLLEEAHYQLRIAEELGYGRLDQEFAELHADIREIQKAVGADRQTTALFAALKQRLAAFRERLSR